MDEDADFEEIEVIDLDEEEALDEDFDEAEAAEIEDTSKLTFAGHKQSVFCSCLNKNCSLAATGGEDDNAFLWDIGTGNVALTCTGHKDSITSVCFNCSDTLLATGDMSGMVQVWNIVTNCLLWCYEAGDMEWLSWHHLSDVLLCGTQSGEIFLWKIPEGNAKVLSSHGSACTSARLMLDGKQIVAGYADGRVKMWDIKSSAATWQVSDAPVTSLEIKGDLCSVAPSSNLIKLSDGKSIGRLLKAGESDIEVHGFVAAHNFLVTGALNGTICVWDLQTQALRHHSRIDSGVTILRLRDERAFLGTTSGVVYVADVKTGALVEVFTGHSANILSLCVADTFLLSTSDDGTAKIFSFKV